MLVSPNTCAICRQPFKVGEYITRVESIYRVGNVHTEATEFGDYAHVQQCPTKESK
jgi:hypothetical protein